MMGLKDKKTLEEYTEVKAQEAHEIKNKIQAILAQSSTSMRKRRIQINKEFDKLESSLADVSQAIAIASGGTKRGLKL